MSTLSWSHIFCLAAVVLRPSLASAHWVPCRPNSCRKSTRLRSTETVSKESTKRFRGSDVIPPPGSAPCPKVCLCTLTLKNPQIKYRSNIWAGLFLGQAVCYEAVSCIPSCLLSSSFWPSQSCFFFFLHSGTTSTEEQWINFYNSCLKPGNEGPASGICKIIWTASESPLFKKRWTETDTSLFSWIFKEN